MGRSGDPDEQEDGAAVSKALEVITRGSDTSGRSLRGTRQIFQHFDRVNEYLGGKMVPVQGSFNKGTTASAGTHDLAGAFDVRVWNLTRSERDLAKRVGRDPQEVGGAAWWERTPAQGFDEHFHFVLYGDSPMTPQTAFQISEYLAGRNGLANRRADDFWRPPVIKKYVYLEDEDMSAADVKQINDKLDMIQERVNEGFANSRDRDKADRERIKAMFSRTVERQGKLADMITVLINQSEDDATKRDLRAMKKTILEELAADPDVDGVDNPSAEGLDEVRA